MRSQIEAVGNYTTCPHSYSSWMKDPEHHHKIKPEQGYDTRTTTTITKVESTLDKLNEAPVINDKAGRYNNT